MDLLAAEITAKTNKDPGEHFRDLTAEFGTPPTRRPGAKLVSPQPSGDWRQGRS